MFSKLAGQSDESKCTGPDVPSDQGQSVLKQPNFQLLELHSKQRNDTNMYSCYNFVYLNNARLLLDNGKNKSKISFLGDIFNEHTLFCGLCETFLHSDILAGVKLNFFLGWPIGPAKIWFGWPAISLAGPRYFIGFGQPIIITIY